jgi:hypothetical protein
MAMQLAKLVEEFTTAGTTVLFELFIIAQQVN